MSPLKSQDAKSSNQPPVEDQRRFGALQIRAFASDLSAFYPECGNAFKRDADTLCHRLHGEGIKVLTTMLPVLGRAVLDGLRVGKLPDITYWKLAKGRRDPVLFGGLFKKVFHADGSLKEHFEVSAVADLLQLCFFAAKLRLPYTPEQEDKVLTAFKATELELWECEFPEQCLADDEILRYANFLIRRVFDGAAYRNEFHNTIVGFIVGQDGRTSPLYQAIQYQNRAEFRYWRDCVPRHGPGTVATGEVGAQKYHIKRKYKLVHDVIGYYNLFYVNPTHLLDDLATYLNLEELEYPVAQIRFVPKDSRGPRIISKEPLEIQWVQQGLARYMMSNIESHYLTRGHVNFIDQTVNQDLARWSSDPEREENFSTLDMKEASDRVSVDLVRVLFNGTPLLPYLMACRSQATMLPDGTEFPLRKFAPMGSAVCFPTESLVFWALAVSAMRFHYGLELGEALKAVYVYGDDLIVDSAYTWAVLDTLPRYGLKFNAEKCYLQGPFRESCGCDALLGKEVTVTRWRAPGGKQLADVNTISLVEYANQLYLRGYWRTAECVRRYISSHSQFSVPYVHRTSNPGFLSYCSNFHAIWAPCAKWAKRYQRHKLYVPVVSASIHPVVPNGWHRLLQYLTTGDLPAGEVRGVSLKHRWSLSY